MFCPKCSTLTSVPSTRKRGEITHRTRECPDCGYEFPTLEREQCPKCGEIGKVYSSRGEDWKRKKSRKCECGKRYTTWEAPHFDATLGDYIQWWEDIESA